MSLTPLTKYQNSGTVRAQPAGGYPTTIAAGTSWQSDLIASGFGGVVVALLMNKNGSITVQRYADLAGVLPVGAALTQAVTANTAAYVGANDGLPFLSFNVTFANTDGTDATVAAAAILTGPVTGV